MYFLKVEKEQVSYTSPPHSSYRRSTAFFRSLGIAAIPRLKQLYQERPSGNTCMLKNKLRTCLDFIELVCISQLYDKTNNNHLP